MTGQLKEVFGIYANDRRQQAAADIVIMTKVDHAAMHRLAAREMERNAAAVAETAKEAKIYLQRGKGRQQIAGLKQLNDLLQEIRTATDREDAIARTGIATGYANAMQHFGLMTKEELQDVIEVVGQAGEKAAKRIEAARRPFWVRIGKGAKA